MVKKLARSSNKSGRYDYEAAPYSMDDTLVERVRQYLNMAGNRRSRYVLLDQLAEHLRLHHVEYRRRKLLPFRVLVQRTYEHVASELRHEFATSSDSEDDGVDGRTADSRQPLSPDNTINRSLTQLYSRSPVAGARMAPAVIDTGSAPHTNTVQAEPNTVSQSTSARPQASVTDCHAAPAYSHAAGRAKRRAQSKHREIDADHDESLEALSKRSRVHFSCDVPRHNLDDIGGYAAPLLTVHDVLEDFVDAQLTADSGRGVPVRSRGVLLHGPPGCGKTLLAEAVAGELQLPFISCASPELVSGVSGDSEQRVRRLFADAERRAPCVLFIDEIDALTSKRELAQRDMERRIVSQLIKCFDRLAASGRAVLVLAATNWPDQLDAALRRAKRFDQEIALAVPDTAGRRDILRVLSAVESLAPDVDIERVARLTPGYVGADLYALLAETRRAARRRSSRAAVAAPAGEDKGDGGGGAMCELAARRAALQARLCIIRLARCGDHQTTTNGGDNNACVELAWCDFEVALAKVQPSALREGFATVPDVSWQDVGALDDVREELHYKILDRVRDPDYYNRLGLVAPSGLLICGPPGCGKTLVAKAVANEAGINFVAVKGPELFNMYVGESERAVRQVFQRARNSVPCVVFFDEIDCVCGRRDAADGGGGSTRVVNQLLTELDGLQTRTGVYLLAATNRPDAVDPALLRPGRVDKMLYVGVPTAEQRADILRAVTRDGRRPCLADDVRLTDVAADRRCDGMTGADLASVVREAAELTARERLTAVQWRHFHAALDRIVPSVSGERRAYYERVRQMCANGARSLAAVVASAGTVDVEH